jgi:hypothetical protein
MGAEAAEATHCRFGLDVKVAKHLIAAPPTEDQADNICINVGTKQGHGPGGAKGMCRDITGKKAEAGAQESDGGLFECG